MVRQPSLFLQQQKALRYSLEAQTDGKKKKKTKRKGPSRYSKPKNTRLRLYHTQQTTTNNNNLPHQKTKNRNHALPRPPRIPLRTVHSLQSSRRKRRKRRKRRRPIRLPPPTTTTSSSTIILLLPTRLHQNPHSNLLSLLRRHRRQNSNHLHRLRRLRRRNFLQFPRLSLCLSTRSSRHNDNDGDGVFSQRNSNSDGRFHHHDDDRHHHHG